RRRGWRHHSHGALRIMIQALAILLCLLASPAWADFYVAPTGSDANPCTQLSPCLTVQKAIDTAPFAATSHIRMADGIYRGAIDIHYWKFIYLDGNCAGLNLVSLRPPVGGGSILTVQDGAIGIATCLEFNGDGYAGVVAMTGRQFSIIDFGNV